MEYEEPQPVDRAALAEAIQAKDGTAVCHALIGLVYSDSDWRWLQKRCLTLLDCIDSDVRGLAVTSLGHIARIHGHLDREIVEGRLREISKDPVVGGRALDALSDIEMFLRAESSGHVHRIF